HQVPHDVAFYRLDGFDLDVVPHPVAHEGRGVDLGRNAAVIPNLAEDVSVLPPLVLKIVLNGVALGRHAVGLTKLRLEIFDITLGRLANVDIDSVYSKARIMRFARHLLIGNDPGVQAIRQRWL